jgi:archaellum component FlaC
MGEKCTAIDNSIADIRTQINGLDTRIAKVNTRLEEISSTHVHHQQLMAVANR